MTNLLVHPLMMDSCRLGCHVGVGGQMDDTGEERVDVQHTILHSLDTKFLLKFVVNTQHQHNS